jgi:signal transduction histidine kinase
VEEAYETIFAIGLVTLFMYGLLVLGFIKLNKSLSKKIWKPFEDTLTKLKSFDLSKAQSIQFDHSDIEEFAELNQTISSLITQNISVYSQQKAFVTNASHELQTPIALLKSKLDLLFQQENLSREHSEMIQALQIPLARLTRVNKNLLLLAKIENSRFGDVEAVDFQGVLDRSIDLLQDYVEERHLDLKKEIRLYELVSCSRFLAETLVNNLLSNAIRHTQNGGEIAVSLSNNTLTFRNSGKAKLDESSLFKRFSISTTETTNSGLGLAIVKEICKQNDWTIRYDFADFTHIFSVQFRKF